MFSKRDRERCEQLYDKYYRGRKFHDSLYREKIGAHLKQGAWVLDAGCGRYMTFCKELTGVAGRVVGIDLETTLETDNQSAPFGIRGDLDRLPFPDASFDLIISRSVVEHLLNPQVVFNEFSRVLRPGGKVVLITPNKYDYVSIIAALTPYSWHRAICSRVFNVPEDDVFPTAYRANTAGTMEKLFGQAGLVKRELDMINHYPAYLMFSPILFRIGVLYERITSLSPFGALRGSILAVFEKTGGEAPRPVVRDRAAVEV
ncbi:MAG: class I SAM-dependent methyltransferase [Bryobacterales bacterium]|nr:class I SAM-dependent methyltransferase [Bryobacterales bacterium]